ncbi:MAG: sigma-54 dependent transcriptional regulator [Acidobacteriota bacterium]
MSHRARILVCDDDDAARRGILRALGRDGYTFVEAASGAEALDRLEALAVDLLLLDLRMPGLDGRATLERVLERPAPPPVIIVTADAQLRTAVDLVRAGAADFVAKPFELEELRWVVQRTLEGDALRRRNHRLEADLRRLAGGGRLLGESPPMRALLAEIAQVAPTPASVLVRGETGTGKELVARRLHELSGAVGPFVALNCAAVPEGLLESELFGHRKGAFTGADRDRAGRFREAHGGTLFLDEIGDMPPAAQAKLLRVLQERVVEPLGGGTPMEVDVRVVAATHRDLRRAVADGAFREDLYYRLRVVELELPPLRARGDDVLELARAFLAVAGAAAPTLTPAGEDALRRHPWPGNVRELKNAMERAAIFARGPVTIDDLPVELRKTPAAQPGVTDTADDRASPDSEPTWPPGTSFRDAKDDAVRTFERAFVQDLLRRHDGNISRAARDADMHRQNLQRTLRRLDLRPSDRVVPDPPMTPGEPDR